ncbi:MAG: hypothetical protein FWG73_07790 [Planctomycetaceae bacterium]|nr:hypothetical protein [Planctomycetaceae bacterium]
MLSSNASLRRGLLIIVFLAVVLGYGHRSLPEIVAILGYSQWMKTALPVFDYSQDRIIDWQAELGNIEQPEAIADWKESRIITHALGRIDEHAVTNSKEALIANYKRGARVFEVDLLLTEDGRLVCVHDWKSFTKDAGLENVAANRTFTAFMQAKIHGQYTPMSFRDLAMMMKHCPDVFIVTDTKKDWPHHVHRAFAALVADAKSVDESILERIIPQLYNPAMPTIIEEIHPFKEYIFTVYKRNTWESRILRLLDKRPEVQGVAFPPKRISPSFCERLKSRDIRSYTHTVNAIEDIKRYAALGVDGFYSDDLTNENLRSP